MVDRDVNTIAARLDRLPGSRAIWALVGLISFGAFFEIYDIALTAVISPGLERAGVFHRGGAGLFGLSDQATFVAATFLGLWLGTLTFSSVADRLGRRPIFTYSLLWYAAASAAMSLQSTAAAVDAWRLIGSLGVGMQLVTIDCYLAELVPPAIRGRAFSVSNFIQYLAVPAAGAIAVLVVPRNFLAIAGWKWLGWFPALGALAIWWVQRALPESPRWLADHGRLAEADAILRAMEARIAKETGTLPLPGEPLVSPRPSQVRGSLWRPPYRRRVAFMAVFHLLQGVGYYGFANWLPTLLEAQGVTITKSLAYSTAVALSYPIAPLLVSAFADRIQRKWQIVLGALGSAACGLLFASQSSAAGWIVLGVLLSLSNILMAIGFHAYQSELFPTVIRARAVGFVYSFSRLSTVFSGYLIALLLQASGVRGVFAALAATLATAAIVVATFGPRTTGASLEEISPS